MSILRSVAWNTVVQAMGRAAVMALSLVSVGLTTRYLGQQAYGDLTTILVYISLFGVLTDLGLSPITVREMSATPQHAEAILGNTLGLRAFLSVGALLLAAFVVAGLPYSKPVKLGSAIAALSLPLIALSATLSTVYQARLEMLRVALADVVSKGVSVVLVASIVWLGGGFYLFLWATVLSALAGAAFLCQVSRGVLRIRVLADFGCWTRLAREALPLGLAALVTMAYFKIDTIMLSLMKPSADVGIYGVAFKIFEMVLALPGFFAVSIFPVLSRLVAVDRDRVAATLQKAFDLLVVVALPVAAGAYLFAPRIVALIGGAGFAEAALPLRILMVGAAFAFVNTMLGYALVAMGGQRQLLWLEIGAFLGNVLVNLALIPRFSFAGAAAATSVCEVAILGAALCLVQRACGFVPSLRTASKGAISTLAMVLVLLPMISTNPFLPALLGGAVYIGVLYLLGGVSRDHLLIGLRG